MNDQMLFDFSPIRDEDGKKKKKVDRPVKVEHQPFYSAEYDSKPGFICSIDGYCRCETCGLTIVDLLEILRIDGEKKWRVICGWWCMTTWIIDPIPGLLDVADNAAKQFVLREGRFAGQTFDQVWNSGHQWHVRVLAKKAKRSAVAKAAAEWLKAKGY